MSFRSLVMTVTFVSVFAMALRVSVANDTWWHLRAGAWMIEQGQLLRSDPFSLTRFGEPWVYPGWLAQLVFFGTYQAFGLPGLNLLTAVMVLLAFAFVWPLLEGPPLLRAFVMLLAATASGVYWSARPQILSFALTGATIWILERARRGERRLLWFFPVIMALWANLHGGFAIGFVLIGAYLASELLEMALSVALRMASIRQQRARVRQLVLSLLAASLAGVAAISVNPHGPVMLLYPFKTVSIQVLQRYIQEWQSPDFHQLEAQPFLWMLLLAMISLALSRRRTRAIELMLIAGFAYMSLLAGRNIALFALVASVPLSRHGLSALEPILDRVGGDSQLPERITKGLNLVLVARVVLAALAKVSAPLSRNVNEAAVRSRVPVAAVNFIKEEKPAGPLFNSYNWGAFVIWDLYPDYRSFVDGRTDLFDDAILEEYLSAWRADAEWREILARWRIQLVLLEPDSPLARTLERSGWDRLYGDDQAVVLSRAAPP